MRLILLLYVAMAESESCIYANGGPVRAVNLTEPSMGLPEGETSAYDVLHAAVMLSRAVTLMVCALLPVPCSLCQLSMGTSFFGSVQVCGAKWVGLRPMQHLGVHAAENALDFGSLLNVSAIVPEARHGD